jgi:hypothetical protein
MAVLAIVFSGSCRLARFLNHRRCLYRRKNSLRMYDVPTVSSKIRVRCTAMVAGTIFQSS